MSFHIKALLAFITFHLVITAGGLIADHVKLMNGVYSDETLIPMDVVATLWGIFCLGISVAGLGLAYLLRMAIRMFRNRNERKFS